jgi:biotin-dependent carboxylase-like uncharacterized protein
MTTLQDLGRKGYQHLGIPVSGALDAVSLIAANAIVGNAPGTGALEIAHLGPTLLVEAESARLAFAGGAAAIEVLPGEGAPAGRRRLAPLQSVRLLRGETLRIGALSGCALGYLAVEGGFDAAPVLGSQSTYARAGLGGFDGRALRAGDLLPLQRAEAEQREEAMLPSLDLAPPGRIRVVLGPQDDCFSERGKRTFLEGTFTVSAASDRMGMRLDGPALEHSGGFNIVSDGIAPGSIQVPGNGLPIVCWPTGRRPALSQDRHRHRRRPAGAGAARARRQGRLRGGEHRRGRGRAPAACSPDRRIASAGRCGPQFAGLRRGGVVRLQPRQWCRQRARSALRAAR